MKKSITLLCTIATLAICFTFTSCMNEDVGESIVLSGQWRGDWGMYYEFPDRYGRIYRYDSFDTDIVFYPQYDYATYGYGYQVDWYDYGPYERLSFRFTWRIDNGIVRIYYPGYPEYDTYIRSYRLDNDYFSGYIGDSSTRFRLSKIRDYYDWSYYYNYDYHQWEWGYYYGKTRSADSEETTVSPDAQIIKIGNRYTE
ncbi:MAG: hypothetical protein J1F40_01845 [Prevotellaceae bacterium]|nr:hypothetical protein [Prevotellaceae bacterium]